MLITDNGRFNRAAIMAKAHHELGCAAISSPLAIGSAAASLSQDRPEYWSAGLYKGAGDGYFLAGSGGFRRQFTITQDDGTVKGGSKIIPMTSGDAQAWAEQGREPSRPATV